MGRLVFVMTLLVLSGCASSEKLKRCDAKAVDPDLWSCVNQIQGPYWKCNKPLDLYRCSDPQ